MQSRVDVEVSPVWASLRFVRRRTVVVPAILLLLPRAATVWFNDRGWLAFATAGLTVIGCAVLAFAGASLWGDRLVGLRTRVVTSSLAVGVAMWFGAIVVFNTQPSWLVATRAAVEPPDIALLLYLRVLLAGPFLLGFLVDARSIGMLLERAP